MEEIRKELIQRGINRLCHFTKSKNLAHILNSFDGILATDMIPNLYKEVNDNHRLDGKKDYICCSIQYPNVYYLERIRDNCKLFKEWIIITIDPSIILNSDTMFCKVNAATENGKFINRGIEGLRELYDKSILTKNRTINRTELMPDCCPTDIQAEVMIFGKIPKEYIKEIIVPTEQQAKEESIRMSILGVENPPDIKVCSELFSKNLANQIRKGCIPKEQYYKHSIKQEGVSSFGL